jgi:hypothetical protein
MTAAAAAPQPYGSPTAGRHALWRHIFGDQTGLLAIWSGRRVPSQQDLAEPSTRYFEWPRRATDASWQLDRESDAGREAYFCAHLLTKKRRVKENAAPLLALYVDGDGFQPGPGQPRPTAIVESSPGRQHFYYRLTRAIDPKRGEQLNKRLAAAMGADKSGWDLSQVLRGPGCRNWKYTTTPTVMLISIDESLAYDPDELERSLPPLPDDKPERPAVRLERSITGGGGPIGDRDRRALERMRASARGAEIAMLEAGGTKFSKPDGSPDGNRDDLSMLSAYAFWLDKEPARMARAAWQTARPRPKWGDVHYANGETYLEHSIGTAISNCSRTFRELTGYDAGDEVPQIQFTLPDEPVAPSTGEPTTLEEALAEVQRLQRALLDRDDRIERMAGIIEDQMQIIAATRAKRDQLAELRARDRRTDLAKARVRRAWKPGQADAIIAVATIAPPIANAHQTDAPIITRSMVAETNGSHVGSAGENLKVFDLPGSPIKRSPKPLGTKELTTYQVGGLTTPEILEQMAELGERIKEQDGARPATRAKRVRCPDHPDAGTIASIVCAAEGCGNILDERHIAAPVVDNSSETRALEATPPAVDALRTTSQARNADVAGPEPDPDARAAAMVATDTGRDVDTYKRLQTRLPIDFEAIREAHQQANQEPDWLREWPDHDREQPPPAEPLPVGTVGAVRPGRCVLCPGRLAPGDRVACRVHQAGIAAAAAAMPELRPQVPLGTQP